MLVRLKRCIRSFAKEELNYRTLSDPKLSKTFADLDDVMAKYTTDHLVGIDEASFREQINKFLELNDYEMENYSSPDSQRDLSIKFHWGHNHDFGSFKLDGLMHDRHKLLYTQFFDGFELTPKSVEGLRVLDIGAWTGGISLLLAGMGAEVVAIEEVRKYCDALEFLSQSFGLEDKIKVHNLSLYELADKTEFMDSFDLVFYAGVIYHVTDPVLSLRIMFNALKDSGVCLVESATLLHNGKMVLYEGPERVWGGTGESQSRRGWNWYSPSPRALQQMMFDVGFQKADVALTHNHSRVVAAGQRKEHTDMLRAGLARPDIK